MLAAAYFLLLNATDESTNLETFTFYIENGIEYSMKSMYVFINICILCRYLLYRSYRQMVETGLMAAAVDDATAVEC